MVITECTVLLSVCSLVTLIGTTIAISIVAGIAGIFIIAYKELK